MNPKDWTENQSKKVFMQFFLADLQKKKKRSSFQWLTIYCNLSREFKKYQ